MEGVTVVEHPLVQHKLTLMRDKTRSTKAFRQLLHEIGMLLCYEVTRDLPLEAIDIETPMASMKSPVLAGKKLVFAPILRAGRGFVDGMLELVPSARVAHIGLYREPKTLVSVEYYFKAPEDVAERLVIVMDPMRATGSRSAAAPISAFSVCWRRRKASKSCARTIPRCTSGPPRSTSASMTTA